MALIEYARLTGRPFRVFSLDTGRLNAETYRYFAQVGRAGQPVQAPGAALRTCLFRWCECRVCSGACRSTPLCSARVLGWLVSRAARPAELCWRCGAQVEAHYGIRIEYCFPEAKEVEDLVRTKGMFSFYEDGHQECCAVRKVKPHSRATRRAWSKRPLQAGAFP